MPFQLREADGWKICTKWTNQTPRAGQYTGDRSGMKRCLMIYYTWYVFILPCGQVDNSILSILLNWSCNTRDSVEPRPRHMIGMFASLNSVMCRCKDLYVHNIYIYVSLKILLGGDKIMSPKAYWIASTNYRFLCQQKGVGLEVYPSYNL